MNPPDGLPLDAPHGYPRTIALVAGTAAVVIAVAIATLAGSLGGAFWAVWFGCLAAWITRATTNKTIEMAHRISDVFVLFENETGVAVEVIVARAATISTRLPAPLHRAITMAALNLTAAAYRAAPAGFREQVTYFWADLASDATGNRLIDPARRIGMAIQILASSVSKRIGPWARTHLPSRVRDLLTTVAFDGPALVLIVGPVVGLAVHYLLAGGTSAVTDKLGTLAVVATTGALVRRKYRRWRRLRKRTA